MAARKYWNTYLICSIISDLIANTFSMCCAKRRQNSHFFYNLAFITLEYLFYAKNYATFSYYSCNSHFKFVLTDDKLDFSSIFSTILWIFIKRCSQSVFKTQNNCLCYMYMVECQKQKSLPSVYSPWLHVRCVCMCALSKYSIRFIHHTCCFIHCVYF